jgi:hypothetical protein
MVLLVLFGVLVGQGLGGVVGRGELGEQLCTGGLLESFIERESGDVPGVVPQHGVDEGRVDGLVTDRVGEDVDAIIDKDLSIFQGVFVRGYVKAILVGLIDDSFVDGSLHLRSLIVERVDPDFDNIGVTRGEGVDLGAGLVGSGREIDLVFGDHERRRSARNADASARGEDSGSAERAGTLLGAEFVDQVAVEAKREDGGDAVALELVESGGDVGEVVGGRRGRCVGFEHSEMGMRADEARDEGLAGAVDDGDALGDGGRRGGDGFDEAGGELDVHVLARGNSSAVDDGGVAQ